METTYPKGRIDIAMYTLLLVHFSQRCQILLIQRSHRQILLDPGRSYGLGQNDVTPAHCYAVSA